MMTSLLLRTVFDYVFIHVPVDQQTILNGTLNTHFDEFKSFSSKCERCVLAFKLTPESYFSEIILDI